MFDTQTFECEFLGIVFQVLNLQLLFRADHIEEVLSYSDFYRVDVNEHASLEVRQSIKHIWYFRQYFLLISRTFTSRNIIVTVEFKFAFYKWSLQYYLPRVEIIMTRNMEGNHLRN